MTKHVELYQDNQKEWRWKFYVKVFGKEETLSVSSEGYKKDIDAISALQTVVGHPRNDVNFVKILDGKETNFNNHFHVSSDPYDR